MKKTRKTPTLLFFLSLASAWLVYHSQAEFIDSRPLFAQTVPQSPQTTSLALVDARRLLRRASGHGLSPQTTSLALVDANRAEEPGRQSAVCPKDGVIKLFDGKTLNGFYTWLKDTKYEDPRHVFRVTDGMIHITGNGLGSLITKKAYRDYHLVLDFKWGERTWEKRKERTRDSGLLIHSVGADGGYHGVWMPSTEVQIIQGGVGDFIMVSGNDKDGIPVPMSLTCETGRDRDGEVIWQKGGQRETFNLKNRRRINWFHRDPDWVDVLDFRGKDDVESPRNQWTRLDVICDGGHIQVYANGTLVNEAFEALPSYGRLQLQTELAEIFFRRYELWPVNAGPKPGPAEQ